MFVKRNMFLIILNLVSFVLLSLLSSFVYVDPSFYISMCINNVAKEANKAIATLDSTIDYKNFEEINLSLKESVQDKNTISSMVEFSSKYGNYSLISASNTHNNLKYYSDLGIYMITKKGWEDLKKPDTIFISKNIAEKILDQKIYDNNILNNLVSQSIQIIVNNNTEEYIIGGVFGYPDDKIYNSFLGSIGDFCVISRENFSQKYALEKFVIKFDGGFNDTKKACSILKSYTDITKIRFPGDSVSQHKLENCITYLNTNLVSFSFVRVIGFMFFIVVFVLYLISLFYSFILLCNVLLNKNTNVENISIFSQLIMFFFFAAKILFLFIFVNLFNNSFNIGNAYHLLFTPTALTFLLIAFTIVFVFSNIYCNHKFIYKLAIRKEYFYEENI